MPRCGSDSPDWMYLSGKAIHAFWGTHPLGPADLQKVINVGLCADQITFAAKNRLDINSGAVI